MFYTICYSLLNVVHACSHCPCVSHAPKTDFSVAVGRKYNHWCFLKPLGTNIKPDSVRTQLCLLLRSPLSAVVRLVSPSPGDSPCLALSLARCSMEKPQKKACPPARAPRSVRGLVDRPSLSSVSLLFWSFQQLEAFAACQTMSLLEAFCPWALKEGHSHEPH